MSPLPNVKLGSDEPLYNIGVVARMTDLTMSTLRAWERRYNFPTSERTSGGHRLYSERDVLHLKWVKERIQEGMQTAQAINALQHQIQVGHLTILEQPEIHKEFIHVEEIRSFIQVTRERLQKALLDHDIEAADLLLSESLAVSTPDNIILDIISPVFATIGDLWVERKINIADEHFATNYLRHRLLMWMVSGPPPQKKQPIVLACAPDEWHDGSLLILGALLRRRRWSVAYLGQAVPLKDLADFIKSMNTKIVVVNAMTESTADALQDWQSWLPEETQSGKLIFGYGGRVFIKKPEWRTRIQGVYLGDTFRTGLDNIERLYLNS
jgi:MerR family transcriptional regulator, light-induced transcriptional regulator